MFNLKGFIRCVRDETAIPPLSEKDVVRGQCRGYRNEKGVAQESSVETYVAARLAIHNPRWAGVPILYPPRAVCCIGQKQIA